MGDLLVEAARDRKPMRIHLERRNWAMRLCERIVLVHIGDNDVYYLLELSAGTFPTR